jgi:hypothetical protein
MCLACSIATLALVSAMDSQARRSPVVAAALDRVSGLLAQQFLQGRGIDR